MSPVSILSRAHPVWLVLGCLLCQMGAGFFFASRTLAGDVTQELGWTREMWASGMAPMLVVSSVGQAFVGAACARFGVRRVVVASLLCMGLSILVFSRMQHITHFYAAMMLLALANAGLGDVSIGSVITRSFDRWRSVALGCALVGSNLGSVVYIGAMGLILSDVGWREASLVVGLGGISIILPIAALVIREPRPSQDGAPRAEPARDEAAGGFEPAPAAPRSTGEILRMPAFWIYAYALFCYALVLLGLIDQLVFYLTDLGHGTARAAAALQLTFGAGIVAKLGAGFVVQGLSARRAFLANTAMLTGSLMLVPFASDERVLALFGVAFGLSTAARDVLLALAVGETFGSLAFARVYGLMNVAFVPGGALGPLALALGREAFGTYLPGFYVCTALVGLAVLALAALPRFPLHPTPA